MKPTLLVLAAGMGSRYGSLKQMDGLGPNNEAIIDYSIYDAIRAGFGKVVFVIRHSFADDFKATFNSDRFGGKIIVEYAYQELDYLPYGYTVPEGRVKPWGTNHAVMMGESLINEPFAVINSDDFYGQDAFKVLADYLTSIEGTKGNYCMVGYKLENTLSDFGGVSRGVCQADAEGNLTNVVEHFDIKRGEDGQVSHMLDGERFPLDAASAVSMNIWGFTPEYFQFSADMFKEFLDEQGSNLKSEFFIPYVVNTMIHNGDAKLKILKSDAKWFGVTFKEDRPFVVDKINELIAEGVYPSNLWK